MCKDSPIAVEALDNNVILGSKAVLLTETPPRRVAAAYGNIAKGIELFGEEIGASSDPQAPIVPPWITPLVPVNIGHFQQMIEADDSFGCSDSSRGCVSPSGGSLVVPNQKPAFGDVDPDQPLMRFDESHIRGRRYALVPNLYSRSTLFNRKDVRLEPSRIMDHASCTSDRPVNGRVDQIEAFDDNLDEDEIDDEPSKGVNKEQYNINHTDGPENLSGSRSASPLLGGVGGTSAPVRHGSLLFQPHSSNNSELVQSSI
ncbi:hypothetical protein DAPPUDRAFT_266073 [Daphnia pulex]|uniref:Uncharacterized protein n=1 Tax=Daphnia pulex TaxID=6669 RepID=E9HUF7_DAPPU|nr:hypothetical protein DAPPUDRAFT_266073 [Daphnia pulex]|eukprot:EFX64624.1 hypothetical protein DAPPUDRAFT_266073 [Daphnia pulex]